MHEHSSRRAADLERDDVVGAAVAALLVNLVGAVPALIGGPDTAWFASLTKPALFPPTWAFGVVWTLLFTLIGVAAYLVYRQGVGRRDVKLALGLFVAQMALNVAWTPVFFGFQEIGLGLVVILALWAVLVATTWSFDRVDRRAALLLVPYLAWVTFAAVLNYRFLVLN